MTQVVRHKSAGEKGRVYSRRARRGAAALSKGEPTGVPSAERPENDGPHPDLLEHLGPAYMATPEGEILWHNDTFIYFARAVWDISETDSKLVTAPPALQQMINTLVETGHFEPGRIYSEAGGVERVFRGRHFLSQQNGAPVVYGYFEDITQRIAAERRLTALDDKLTDVIRSTSDWVWETDTEMRLTEVSARIAAITGAPPDAHLGKAMLSLGTLPDPMPGIPDLNRLMADRRPFRNRLFLMRDETGQARRIHLSATPFFDSDTGRFLGYRGTGTDVTRALEAERDAVVAREKLEEAMDALEVSNEHLREALEKSQSASEAKSDFLALTSHELRTPLNAIIGFAELSRRMIDDTVPERLPSYLDNILSASGHLVQIIDNLLDTVRIENETVDMALIETSVADLIRDTISMVEVRAEMCDIALSIPKIPEDLTILADRTSARQILINLLTNAIKFTSEGGNVGIDIVPGKADLLYITVWDTGLGIPIEQQQAVFDRFHRVRDDTLTTNTEGVGIGLHVARNLAQLMGGDITLESEIGNGSRFTLALRLWEQVALDPVQQLDV
ncbi:MAG: PAS domain-containing sensor histidine kinase [Alphaproteobacteria bacterium]